ncbi:hypothetical protein [Microvirga sp. KLBC 81]|nr:hypothetical protein [Microvirga sp. KLBC 81]
MKPSQHFHNSFYVTAAETHYIAASRPLSPDFAQIACTKSLRPGWHRSNA